MPPADLAENPSYGVAVILPTYNRANYLPEAIDGILAQSLKPRQIIIVNDGSTDKTIEVVERYGAAVELVTKPNGGKSTALNLGLGLAREPLVWIFDDDDIAVPDALQLMVAALAAEDGAGFSYGAYNTFQSEEVYTPASLIAIGRNTATGESHIAKYGLYLGLMIRNFIMQPGMLVRKRCFEAVGPFDERLVRSQDYEMLLRLARQFRGARVDEIVFHQRQHRGTRGSLANPVKAENVLRSWISFDRLIFKEINDSHTLQDFLPKHAGGPLSPADRITAHLIRGCIMGRRHLWELAADDFEQFALSADQAGKVALTNLERDTLRQVLDIWNFAPTTVLHSPGFHLALGRIGNRSLREQVRAALLYPMPYLIRNALKDKSPAETWAIVRTYARLATPGAAWRNLLEKIASKTWAR